MQITDELIQTVADFKQELYNRLDKIRQLEQTRKEFLNQPRACRFVSINKFTYLTIRMSFKKYMDVITPTISFT